MSRDDEVVLRAVPGTGPDLDEPDGRTTRWAEHREARRAELVRAARRVVHKRGPDVSMEEIAAAAGTSKSIVYRYFNDKTGLQIAVGELVVGQIEGAIEAVLRLAPSPREGLRSMIAVYLDTIEQSPNVYAFVTRGGSVELGGPLGHFQQSVAALVAARFTRLAPADDEGRAEPDEADRWAAQAWAAGVVGYVRGAGEWWMAHRADPGCPDRTALADRLARWLWAGPGALTPARPAAVPSTT
ncbi:TetR/AcrR family transcriptional regulator [Cellulomonas marina]|uniref:DNA-binding transcriptional regulator, AcrR family n=1 Tax=Cellulomonas marina TaxID=988821 RepID=A0A1I0Z0I4_9CELL|nr:TetR/AcrR family transcriptional regulator [Cellulomonas marina]GIG28162.1 hypothetical protein Cma02nite_07620 [Cellulomonas marina]SFB19209.1 DNA-binding transcriptional regulator, AcrR family [Cellulomonas marina]